MATDKPCWARQPQLYGAYLHSKSQLINSTTGVFRFIPGLSFCVMTLQTVWSPKIDRQRLAAYQEGLYRSTLESSTLRLNTDSM